VLNNLLSFIKNVGYFLAALLLVIVTLGLIITFSSLMWIFSGIVGIGILVVLAMSAIKDYFSKPKKY
jgi:hypothetical protein